MKDVPCNLCGADAALLVAVGYDKYLGVDRTKFNLVRCTTCGLHYLNPQPTFDELAKYYPASYPPYDARYEVFEKNRLFDFLRRSKRHCSARPDVHIPVSASSDKTPLTILDFGCGSGAFLSQLRKQLPRALLYGFDVATNPNIRNIDGNITLIQGTFENLRTRLAGKNFDVIYLNNVLEHVLDPSATLANLAAFLKDDGQMNIEVPNIDSIKFKIFRSNFSSLDIPRHLYHFNRSTLSALCEKNGLTVESVAFTGSTKSTVRSLYFAFGIHRDKLDPLLYAILDRLARLVGEKRINTDSLRLTCRREADRSLR